MDPPLDNEPASVVQALGGPLGDLAHDAAALERATAMATERGAMFSHLLLRYPGCFRWLWTRVWAVVRDGQVTMYSNQAAKKPLRAALQVSDCLCQVGEIEDCKTDHYCFRLVHASGTAILCAYNSKEQQLWLQALQAGGVKYEDAPIDNSGVTSLFDLKATLLSGETVDLRERYAGCVCLVVNAASK